MSSQYDARTTVIAVLVSMMLTGVGAWFSFGRETATEGYVEKRIEERTQSIAQFVTLMQAFQKEQVQINTRLTTIVDQLAVTSRDTQARLHSVELDKARNDR